MTRTTRDVRRRSRRAAGAMAGAVVLGATMATSAVSSMADDTPARGTDDRSPRTIQVSGEIIPVDLATGTYEVKGELVGTWTFPPAETVTYYQSTTRLFQKGNEYFEGCVDVDGDARCERTEPRGRWKSEYIYWAFLDRSGRLETGGCTHALVGGSRSYRGVRGLLQMQDVFAATPQGSTSIYQGEIVLNAVDEGPVAVTAPAVSKASTAGVALGC